MWPERRLRPSLVEFLQHEPKLLSLKATDGFVSRLKSGGLRYPPEFMRALLRHADRMRIQPELAVA
jgi:DNA (cytosine-5)-methyltransferase 1